MPASERSLRITDAYRSRLIALTERMGAYTAQQWQQVTLADLDRSHGDWLVSTVAALEQAQRAGVLLSAAYLAAFVASETGRPIEPPTAHDASVGKAEDGQPLAKAFAATLITVKLAIKDGRDDALRAGENRAKRLASTATMSAPRDALQIGMEVEPSVIGWRRATQGASSCGACMASADGRVRNPSERLRIHPFCDCTAEPVLDGVREQSFRPTGRQVFDGLSVDRQNALLGKEKADLIRSGAVPFERLIQPQPMVIAPDGITEAPLAALT